MFPPVDLTRRHFLTIAAVAAVAAVPISTPALAALAAQGSDTELVRAAQDLRAVEHAIEDLLHQYDDAAESRDDYQALEVSRNEHIATLVTVPATSEAGVRLRSVSDAAALIALVDTNIKIFGELVGWEVAVVSNVSKFMSNATSRGTFEGEEV